MPEGKDCLVIPPQWHQHKGVQMKLLRMLTGAGLFAIVFSVSAEPLSLTQWIGDGLNGVDNMHCTQDSITSPDQKFVYAASYCDAALNVFSRDIATGQLNLVDTMVWDEDSGEGFRPDLFTNFVISPDGVYLYTYGSTGASSPGPGVRDGVAVFERNLETGLLTQIQFYEGRGTNSVATLRISNNGNNIYFGAGSSGASPGLLVLNRAENGILTEAQYIEDIIDSQGYDPVVGLALSPSQEYLYAGLDFSENFIIWFKRDVATGRLTFAGEISSKDAETSSLARPDDFVISHDGTSLYMINDDEIWHFTINDDASLSLAERITDVPDGHPKSQFFGPDAITISDNDRLLYFTDVDTLQVWQRDVTTGALSYLGAEEEDKDGVPERALLHVAAQHLSPDGRFTHVAANNGLAVFNISADTSVTITSPAADTTTFDVNIDIQNLGPATAHGVAVDVNLPAGVTMVSASPAGSSTTCEAAEQVVTCTVGTLPDAASEAITLSLQAPQAGGSAGLTAQLSQYEVDPNTANDTDVGLSEPGSTPPGNNTPPTTPPAPTPPAPADPGNSDGGSSGGGGGSMGFTNVLLLLGLLGGRLVARRQRFMRAG